MNVKCVSMILMQSSLSEISIISVNFLREILFWILVQLNTESLLHELKVAKLLQMLSKYIETNFMNC